MRLWIFIGLTALSCLISQGVPAAESPAENDTWVRCDGRARPQDVALVKGLQTVFFLPRLIWKDTAPAQQGAADRAHVAHGADGVAACEAAMSDGRSRDWPARRASQWVALILHHLTAGLQDSGQLPAMREAVARYRAERAQPLWPASVSWTADGWIDAMEAVATMAGGDAAGSAMLAAVADKRPADFDLLRFCATATLLPAFEQPLRARLWARYAAFDHSQAPVARALTTSPSLPFLPSGEELVAELWRQLVPNLNFIEGAAAVDTYSQAGFAGHGFSAQAIDQGTGAEVTYDGTVTSPEMVQEMALYRAAEMADAAGASRLRIKVFTPQKVVQTSRSFMNGAMIGTASQIIGYKVVYAVTFVSATDAGDAASTIEVAPLLASLRQDFIPMSAAAARHR